MRKISRPNRPTPTRNRPVDSGRHPQTIPKGNMRYWRTLFLRDKEYNDTDGKQTRYERDRKQAWVMVIKDPKELQCHGGSDYRTDGVQHSLEAEGATVCLTCNRSRQ